MYNNCTRKKKVSKKRTSIPTWTDRSWNIVTGCTKVSEGCDNCSSEKRSKQYEGKCGYPLGDSFKPTFHFNRLQQPANWNSSQRILVSSMGDLFHDDISDGDILSVFYAMAELPRHTFYLLTKRPKRMLKLVSEFSESVRGKFLLDHIVLGVSVENQAQARIRVPLLLQCPSKYKFVAVEPILDFVSLKPWLSKTVTGCQVTCPIDSSTCRLHSHECSDGNKTYKGIDWVVCSGEVGKDARPANPDWIRGVRDHCAKYSVPFFFKSWGEFIPIGDVGREIKIVNLSTSSPCTYMYRAGVNYTGNILDGKTHTKTLFIPKGDYLTNERIRIESISIGSTVSFEDPSSPFTFRMKICRLDKDLYHYVGLTPEGVIFNTGSLGDMFSYQLDFHVLKNVMEREANSIQSLK